MWLVASHHFEPPGKKGLKANPGGWWLVARWLVAGGWWLVAGGWWLVAVVHKIHPHIHTHT